MTTTDNDQILPPPPSIPNDGGNKQEIKNKELNNNNSEPPRKRMKVDEPQIPHYNSHNMFARPQTGPSTQTQPTSLPNIHPPVTPLFDDDTEMNGNSNNSKQEQNNVESLIGAEVAALPEPQEVWPRCAYCDKGGDLSRCSSCRQAYYCNRECQVAHWEVHCIICQPGPPQPPSLPSGGQPVPQPTTFTSYNPQQQRHDNNNNRDQYNGYSQYNGSGGGVGGHHPSSQSQSQIRNNYHQPPQRPSRRRTNDYHNDNINKEQYYCEECDRYFKNGQALGGHRSRVHSSRRNGGDQGADDPGTGSRRYVSTYSFIFIYTYI